MIISGLSYEKGRHSGDSHTSSIADEYRGGGYYIAGEPNPLIDVKEGSFSGFSWAAF